MFTVYGSQCRGKNAASRVFAFRLCLLALAAWLAVATGARAFDMVKTTAAVNSTITGRVTKMSALEVTAEQGGVSKSVPVNEIEAIYYDNEPTLLKTARSAVSAGHYEDAIAALEKIDLSSIDRAEITQDIEFYKGLASARLALAGNGDIKQAGSLLAGFVSKSSGNYHYLEACELVGDLLVADKKYSTAETFYSYLAKAPWPEYKMRASVAIGRAQLAGGKADAALKSFDTVLGLQGRGEAAERYRLAATLGKARCLAEAGKSVDAEKLVQDVINRGDPEDAQLQADAYNALGIAYRKADRPKDALLAFLHVDVLYFSSPAQHIEALQNLHQLWNELGKPERAADAARVLRERYKMSPSNP